MRSIRALVFAVVLLAIIAFAVSANQQTGTLPEQRSVEARLTALERRCSQLDADNSKFRVEVPALLRELRSVSGNIYRPGMILPYHGPLGEARTLEHEGWFVCDGRMVTDRAACTRFKDKATPNLQDRFLKGSGRSGDFVGRKSVETSSD